MTYKRLAAVAGAATTVLLSVAACASQPAGTVRMQPAPSTSRIAAGTIEINADTGVTFTPTSGSATAPAMTAAQAYAGFAALNNWASTDIPGYVTVQLGSLTAPVGPAGAPGTRSLATSGGEAYTALNEQTWAFSWKECPPVLPPAPVPGTTATPVATPAPSSCVAWLYLDANTGKQIEQTWQQ